MLDVAHPGGPRLGRPRRSALPVPLHLAGSLARYPHLSLAERASVGRAALALRRLDPADPALDGVDFATWLGRYGQSPRTIEALWDLVGIATLNATAGQSSLGLAAMVFKTGLLSENGAADIGWARVPLGDLHDTLARKALDAAGVRTELRTRVTDISRTPQDGWRVATESGSFDAGTVVLAVPQREAHGLLPAGALADPDKLLDIGTAPILNVHVVYDRKVLKQPFFAALGSPVQWVFDRTDSSDCPTAASTWRCPSRSPTRTSTNPSRSCARSTCPSWNGCCPPRAEPRCATSSSPGSAPRPSPPPPASAGCGPEPGPTRRGSSSPVRGPRRVGPRPWRAPSAAD